MHALAMLVLLLGGQAPTTSPAGAPPAAPVPTAGGTLAVPTGAEEEIESALVPRPLEPGEVRDIAAELGVPGGEEEALAAVERKYRDETAAEHAKALAAVRARIAASTRPGAPGAGLSPAEGPERVGMLEAGATWRDALARADGALLARLGALRGDKAGACNGLVACRRAEARDGIPGDDPLAALRLAALIDAAGLDAADRRRVEDALDRQWQSIARAIEERRRRLGAAELARARMLASWGPAWRVGAAPSELADRLARLEEASVAIDASDEPLRRANREAAIALVKVLGTAAADRVRDATDRILWPWLFSADARLAAAARRAGELGGDELAGHLGTLLRELDARLAATRRELGRRASDAEAAAELDDELPGHDRAMARLEAEARLLEVRVKRMRSVSDACARMAQVAASDERAKPVMAEILASVQAERRTLDWELDGIRARIASLGTPLPVTGDGAPQAGPEVAPP